MLKIKNITLTSGLVFLLTLSMNLNAADWVFNVPVNFNNLHEDINSVKVICSVHEPEATGTFDQALAKYGIGNTSAPIEGGKINQTIKVEVNKKSVWEDADTSKATNYTCSTSVCATNFRGCRDMSDSSTDPLLLAKPGATLLIRHTGRFK